jgi:uncharacterized protein (DUF1778 family)
LTYHHFIGKVLNMSTKKAVPKKRIEGVGQRSKKRSGTVLTGLRIPADEIRVMHRAAKADKRSFNAWAVIVLFREAQKVLKNTNKIPGDGPTARAMRAASRGETK